MIGQRTRWGFAALGMMVLTSCGSGPDKPPESKSLRRKAPQKKITAVKVDRGPKRATPPDLSEKAKDPKYKAFVEKLGEACRYPGRVTKEYEGGYTFVVLHDKVDELLEEWQPKSIENGAYFFRLKDSFGNGDAKDTLIVLPTPDRYEAVAVINPRDPKKKVGSQMIIDWLKDLEKEEPFMLTGVGRDFVGVTFNDSVKNVDALAKKVFEISPQTVTEGFQTVDALAKDLEETNKMVLYWRK